MTLNEYGLINTTDNYINGEDLSNVIEHTGKIFNEMKNNIIINGKSVYFSKQEIEGYSQDYWHLGSFEKKDIPEFYYNILPCNNTTYSNKCNNCNTHNFKVNVRGKIRDKCVYRMSTIEWMKQVADKVNCKDKNVKTWYDKKIYNGQLRNNFYIRYEENDIDYLIVLEEKPEIFYFTTAYPVFEYLEKRDLNKSYQKNKI